MISQEESVQIAKELKLYLEQKIDGCVDANDYRERVDFLLDYALEEYIELF